MKVILNGKVKSLSKLNFDTGYYYGYGVFETILIREGVAIFLEEHLGRLNQSLEKIGINRNVTKEEAMYAISALRLYNCALKINVSETSTLFTPRQVNYTVEQYQEGARLMVADVYRNPSSPSTYIKSMNYMDNILTMKQAREATFTDALFLNYNQQVCETTVANIFMFEGDKIFTPQVQCGLLDGIIRRWFCDNFSVEEISFDLERLVASDGAFITNSLMGMMKVSQIGQVKMKEHQKTIEMTKTYISYIKGISD